MNVHPREEWIVKNNTGKTLIINDIPEVPKIKSGESVDLLKYTTIEKVNKSTILNNYILKGLLSIDPFFHTHDDKANIDHIISSHSDTDATGNQINILVEGGNSDADNLHTHLNFLNSINDLSGEINDHSNLKKDFHGISDPDEFATKSGGIDQFINLEFTEDQLNILTNKSNADNLHNHQLVAITDISASSNEINRALQGIFNTVTSSNLSILTDGNNADSLHIHASSVFDHNELSGLDGGTANQYYHFTQTQHDTLTDGSNADGLHTHAGTGGVSIHNDLLELQGGDVSSDEFFHLSFTDIENLITLTDGSNADSLHMHSVIISNHNSLLGLQGGDISSDEFYHIASIDITNLNILTDKSNADSLHIHDHNKLENLEGGDPSGGFYHITFTDTVNLITLTDGSNADSLHTHSVSSGIHNDLTGLQGGTTNEYYHFTQSQHDTLTDKSNADSLHIHDHNKLENLEGGDPSGGFYHIVFTDTVNLITLTDGSNADSLHMHSVIISNHNDLSDLQGGNPSLDEFYHLSIDNINNLITLTNSSNADELHLHSHDNLLGLQGGDPSGNLYHVTLVDIENLITLTDRSNADNLHTHSHNNFIDLQGGTVNEYYHLTQSQHDTLTDGSNADSLHIHTLSDVVDIHNDLIGLQGGNPSLDEFYHLSSIDIINLTTLTDSSNADSLHLHSHDNLLGLQGGDPSGNLYHITLVDIENLITLTDGSNADSLHVHVGSIVTGDTIWQFVDTSLQTDIFYSNGNVAIGKSTSPKEALDVNGNIIIGNNDTFYLGKERNASIFFDGTDLNINVNDPSVLGLIKLNDDVEILGKLFANDDVEILGKLSINTQIGTMTLFPGSITDSSGVISFEDENLTTTGDITIGQKIIHAGDPDTFMEFPSNDVISFDVAGTPDVFRMTDIANIHSQPTIVQSTLEVDDLVTLNDRLLFDGGTITNTDSFLFIDAVTNTSANGRIMRIGANIQPLGSGTTINALQYLLNIHPTLNPQTGDVVGNEIIMRLWADAQNNLDFSNVFPIRSRLVMNWNATGDVANITMFASRFQTNGNYAGTLDTLTYFGVDPGTDLGGITITNLYGLKLPNITAGGTLNYAIWTGLGDISFGDNLFLRFIKSGATQGGAGAAATEIWKTSSHATLPDNVLMIGV